eukprot:SAG22_NODE_1_length_62449_cov_158.689270_11_plen_325_part_00
MRSASRPAPRLGLVAAHLARSADAAAGDAPAGAPGLSAATLAVHADRIAEEAGAAGGAPSPSKFSTASDVAPPISLSTTYEQQEGGHVYSRSSAPTRERCEAVLAAIEGPGVHALLFSSGLSAVHAALVALVTGGGVKRVAVSGGYHGTHQVIELLQALVPLELLELPLPEAAPAVLRPGDLLWIETPDNPTCIVRDVAAYAAAAAAAGGGAGGSKVWLAVDGTFAPPPVQVRSKALPPFCCASAAFLSKAVPFLGVCPAMPPVQRVLDLGADLVMHSSTKYLSGHSDGLSGALCTRDAALHGRLREQRTVLGAVPGSLEVWLL